MVWGMGYGLGLVHLGRSLSGEGQGAHGVHNQVDPEQLMREGEGLEGL